MRGYNEEGKGIIKVFFGNDALNNTAQLIIEKEGCNFGGESDVNKDGHEEVLISQSHHFGEWE